MCKKQLLPAQDVLLHLMDFLMTVLEDILDAEKAGEDDATVQGAKGAYVTCLEFLTLWEKAAEYGLDFDIEEVFPV